MYPVVSSLIFFFYLHPLDFINNWFYSPTSGFLSRPTGSLRYRQPQRLHRGNAVCTGYVCLYNNWMLCWVNWNQRAAHVCFHALPSDVQSWRRCAGDAVWLRNQMVAPVTEELVFRGAMLPMLVPCTGPTGAIVTAPLFFGVGMWKNFQTEKNPYLHIFELFQIKL